MIAGLAIAAPPVMTQEFAQTPIRLIVSYPPGGSTDVVARVIAEAVSIEGRRVIVESLAGAAGQIGWHTVSEAPADGHTVTISTSRALIEDSPSVPSQSVRPSGSPRFLRFRPLKQRVLRILL